MDLKKDPTVDAERTVNSSDPSMSDEKKTPCPELQNSGNWFCVQEDE